MPYIPTYERVMWRDLYTAKSPYDLFLFHEKYLLSPAQILDFLTENEKLGYLIRTKGHASLTNKGKRHAWANRHRIFERGVDRSWRPESTPISWKNADISTTRKIHFSRLDRRILNLTSKQFLAEISNGNGTDG